MNHYLKKLKSFDIVVILFCIITAIFIIFGYNQLQNIVNHILLRIIFLSIIFLLLRVDDTQNKFLIFIRNFYPLVFLGFFYSETDYYNNIIFDNLDFHFVKLESFLFGTQLSIEFSKQFPYRWFSEMMHFGYFSYYILIFGIPFLFYIKHRDQFEKTMFIIILSFCFYYLIFILFPSIGPQFYFQADQRNIPNGYLFHKIMNLIISIGETQTGAFPSSHVGIATIFLILTQKYFKKVFFVLIPFIIILILSTIYIKAHYGVDIIGGIITGLLFFYLSNKLYDKFFLRKDT